MALDRTAALAILKERYSFTRVVDLGYRKNPFFAIIKKDFDAGGEHEKIPMDISNNQAASATFSTAQSLAANTSSKYGAFEIICQRSYGIARLDGRTMASMRKAGHAFIPRMSREIDSTIKSVVTDTERALFRNGTGLIGVGNGSWTVASTTLTLAHSTQTHCFQLGMELGATANATSTPRTGSATITGINRSAGTLTTDSNWSAQITSIANTDSLFRYGDYTAANDKLKILGMDAWCPEIAPTPGDNHHGVDRSQDVERLAGTRYDGSLLNIDEALVNGQSEGSANGSVPRYCFMHNYQMRKLINLSNVKISYDMIQAQGKDGPIADIGFQAVVLQGDQAPIKILSHPLCPYDVAWMFDPDVLVLLAYGDYPAIIDEDGMEAMRIYNDDGVEVRVGGYPELATDDPSSIVRIKLAA